MSGCQAPSESLEWMPCTKSWRKPNTLTFSCFRYWWLKLRTSLLYYCVNVCEYVGQCVGKVCAACHTIKNTCTHLHPLSHIHSHTCMLSLTCGWTLIALCLMSSLLVSTVTFLNSDPKKRSNTRLSADLIRKWAWQPLLNFLTRLHLGTCLHTSPAYCLGLMGAYGIIVDWRGPVTGRSAEQTGWRSPHVNLNLNLNHPLIAQEVNSHFHTLIDAHPAQWVDSYYTPLPQPPEVAKKWVGLARIIHLQVYTVYIYGIFGREITIHIIVYGVYIWFWPTLEMSSPITLEEGFAQAVKVIPASGETAP